MGFSKIELEPISAPKGQDKKNHRAARLSGVALALSASLVGSPVTPVRTASGEGIPQQDTAHALQVSGIDLSVPTTFPLPAEETEAEEETQVLGEQAEASAEEQAALETDDEALLAQAGGGTTTPSSQETAQSRLFEPEYRIPLPYGRMLLVENPKTNINGGFKISPDRQLSIEQANPETFQDVIDPETGKPKMRTPTLGEELGTRMNQYGPSEIIFEEVKNMEEFLKPVLNPLTKESYFWSQETIDSNPLLVDYIIKPKDHPQGIVFRYYFTGSREKLIPEEVRQWEKGIAYRIADALYFFKSAPDNSVIRGGNPINTPERSRLSGEFGNRVAPILELVLS